MGKAEKPLRIWYVSQYLGEPFFVSVSSVEEACIVVNTLRAYDDFQLRNKLRKDYQGLFDLEYYEEGEDDWLDWIDGETGNTFEEYLQEREGEAL